jgi:ATP-dependent Clp protease adapter protein ClpS
MDVPYGGTSLDSSSQDEASMMQEEMATDSVTVETPVVEKDSDNDIKTTEPAKVILFNDDVHTFDEVIDQLIKAIRCSRSRAEAYAWEVHTRGKAAVFEGPMNECIRVSHILEEIALHTQIEV